MFLYTRALAVIALSQFFLVTDNTPFRVFPGLPLAPWATPLAISPLSWLQPFAGAAPLPYLATWGWFLALSGMVLFPLARAAHALFWLSWLTRMLFFYGISILDQAEVIPSLLLAPSLYAFRVLSPRTAWSVQFTANLMLYLGSALAKIDPDFLSGYGFYVMMAGILRWYPPELPAPAVVAAAVTAVLAQAAPALRFITRARWTNLLPLLFHFTVLVVAFRTLHFLFYALLALAFANGMRSGRIVARRMLWVFPCLVLFLLSFSALAGAASFSHSALHAADIIGSMVAAGVLARGWLRWSGPLLPRRKPSWPLAAGLVLAVATGMFFRSYEPYFYSQFVGRSHRRIATALVFETEGPQQVAAARSLVAMNRRWELQLVNAPGSNWVTFGAPAPHMAVAYGERLCEQGLARRLRLLPVRGLQKSMSNQSPENRKRVGDMLSNRAAPEAISCEDWMKPEVRDRQLESPVHYAKKSGL